MWARLDRRLQSPHGSSVPIKDLLGFCHLLLLPSLLPLWDLDPLCLAPLG